MRCLVVLVLITSAFSSSAFADKKADTMMRNFIASLWDAPTTKDNILFFAAMTKISDKDLLNMNSDLQKTNFEKFGQFSLKDNQVLLDGKKIGIEYVSYVPVKMKIGFRDWQYNNEKSVFENYEDVANLFLLTHKKKTSLLQIVLPEAQAQTAEEIKEDTKWQSMAYTGAAVGVIGAGVGCSTTAIAGCAAGAMVLGEVGSDVGAYVGYKASPYIASLRLGFFSKTGIRRAELVDWMLKSNPTMTCNGNSMTIYLEDPSKPPLIKVTKDSDETVTVLDLNGHDLLNPSLLSIPIANKKYVSDGQVAMLRSAAEQCKTQHDADFTMATLRNAEFRVQQVARGTGGGQSGTPASAGKL